MSRFCFKSSKVWGASISLTAWDIISTFPHVQLVEIQYVTGLFYLIQFSFLRTICPRGLRLKTWDHALSHPSCHSSRLLYDGFCWTAVSCEPLTLGTHTDRILNYQLPHSPTHDLNVLGKKRGLLGVECKEGAVIFSAIRPFTNHHWPLEGAQPNMESREWVGTTLPLPCPTPPPKQGSFSIPEAQSAHWVAMPAYQWWFPECAQRKALSPRCHAISTALTEIGCLSHMSRHCESWCLSASPLLKAVSKVDHTSLG